MPNPRRSPKCVPVGIAILAISFLILTFLVLPVGVVATFRSLVTNQAGSQHDPEKLAIALAEFGLGETVFAFDRAINDPESPSFPPFRSPMTHDPGEGFVLNLGDDALTQTRLLASSPPFAQYRFKIQASPPKVLYRRLFESTNRDNRETHGTIAFRIQIEGEADGKPVVRSLEGEKDFKVVCSTVPPPFDQIGLLFLDALPLLGGTPPLDLQTRLSGTQGACARLVAALEGQSPEDPRVGALKARIKQLPVFGVTGTEGEATGAGIALEQPMMAYLTQEALEKGPIRGADMALASNPEEGLQKVATLEDRAKETEASLSAGLAASSPPQPEVLTAALNGLESHVQELESFHEIFRAWKNRFETLSGERRAKLMVDVPRLSTQSLARKALFVLREGDRDINQAFRVFRKELESLTGSRGLHGLIQFENPRTTLDLTQLNLEGRVVLSATGNVKVGDVHLASLQDHVVIVSQGTMQLVGDVEGSLVSMGPLLVPKTARIQGSLIVARPDPVSLAQITLASRPGTRAYGASGKNQYEGVFFHVGLSPDLKNRRILAP